MGRHPLVNRDGQEGAPSGAAISSGSRRGEKEEMEFFVWRLWWWRRGRWWVRPWQVLFQSGLSPGQSSLLRVWVLPVCQLQARARSLLAERRRWWWWLERWRGQP